MNTAALKTFAPAVRRQLLEAVSRKLDYVLSAQTPDYLATYAQQVVALRKLAQDNRTGLIERVAYTWFNRLTALRYLDARGWHPFRARVLTPASLGETQPEVLKLTRMAGVPEELRRYTNPGRLNDLLDGHIPSPNPQGEVYRHLVLAACRFYNELLPDLFERLEDATELLLPDDLLTEQSVVHGFRTEISDDDCTEVELIGWLYQFYISERKNEIIARKSSIPREDIPTVTQLFTPHWIVRFLLENSLGRLWLRNRPDSRLRDQMPYYIEAEKDSEYLHIEKPEDIRLLDPACGSGHMLTYAFDLLYAIYAEEGYAPAEIPLLILEHNLYGIDICPRAAQLAALALVLKAREKSRRFIQSNGSCAPRITTLRDVTFEEGELSSYSANLGLRDVFHLPMLKLLTQFTEATTYGSLIRPCVDEQAIESALRAITSQEIDQELFLRETHAKVLRVLLQAQALNRQYTVVVTNPPYMGQKGMNANIRAYITQHYKDYKSDLFAAFMVRCISLVQGGGSLGFMTPFVWMFLSSYESLRQVILKSTRIASLVQPEYHAFFESAYVPICAFTLSKTGASQAPAVFIRLSEFYGEELQPVKTLEAITNASAPWRYQVDPSSFLTIPGAPIAYWISEKLRQAFGRHVPLGQIASPRQGMATGENARFVRFWYEVSLSSIAFRLNSLQEAPTSGKKWFPYNKGGEFRRWYGNQSFVVDWENDGYEIRNFADEAGSLRSRVQNSDYYFLPSVSWSKISSALPAFRYFPNGFMFDVAGTSIYAQSDGVLRLLLGFANSCVARRMLEVLSPTLNFEVGHISALPVVRDVLDRAGHSAVEQLVRVARDDWDNAETSWEFCDMPLLRPSVCGATLEVSWQNWKALCESAVSRMQELERENNRLFIEAYGLQDELRPEVPREEITLARADAQKDMAAFLSYAVGCLMGRYSLDHPGLILANAGDSMFEFLAKVNLSKENLTFAPDEDGIIPVLDGEWFESDIVTRTREFLRATFGEATLRDNIRFIEDSLGKDLRKYFLTDFYKDHLQTYKKRPIYWMVQSPKKSFSVLVYLHRYTRDTMNLVLNRYLREYEVKLRNRIERLTQILADASTSTRDRTAARKESDKLIKALHDCEEWERQTLLPLAQERIELDLDDGVKVNYLKLGEALAPIPGLAVVEE